MVSSLDGFCLGWWWERLAAGRVWSRDEHLIPESRELFLLPVVAERSEAKEASEEERVLGVWIRLILSELTLLVLEVVTLSGEEVAGVESDDSDRNSVRLIISNRSELVSE